MASQSLRRKPQVLRGVQVLGKGLVFCRRTLIFPLSRLALTFQGFFLRSKLEKMNYGSPSYWDERYAAIGDKGDQHNYDW
jgi:hypothetical protein